jgi:hypothetical protein
MTRDTISSRFWISPPSDTTQWVPTQQSVSQAKFEGSGPGAPLEHPGSAVTQPAPSAALSLLHELAAHRPLPQWRHWVVGMGPNGRITLPPGARRAIGSESCAQAATRGGMLVLHHGGPGASLAIDRRGRPILPTSPHAVRSSGSVLVAARTLVAPAVVLVPTVILDDLVSHVVAESV